MDALYRLSYKSKYKKSPFPFPFRTKKKLSNLERVRRIELLSSAWKAEVIANIRYPQMVEGGGFEPPKALLADLQSAPFGRSGNPPDLCGVFYRSFAQCQPQI